MKQEPKWKYAERLVAMIERSLSPETQVKHDVKLKVIGSAGRKRQRDVVIWIGAEPRRQFVIVEVQKRGTRPSINTFDGWLEKMREVGASGMICVSEKGFPKSIIEKVATFVGPRVKLVTFSPGEDESYWADFDLVPRLKVLNWHIIVEAVEQPRLRDPCPSGPPTLNPQNVSVSLTGKPDDIRTLSQYLKVQIVTIDALQNHPVSEDGYAHAYITFAIPDSADLWVHAPEGVFRVSSWALKFAFKRFEFERDVPFTRWSYKQQGIGSSIAWVATAEIDLQNLQGSKAEWNVVFVPDKEGYLRATSFWKAPPEFFQFAKGSVGDEVDGKLSPVVLKRSRGSR